MRQRLALAFMTCISLACPLHARDWLDLKLPSMEVDGSLVDVARQLQKFGIRVCVEEVTLRPSPPIARLRIRTQEKTLKDFLEGLTRMDGDLGWSGDYFLMSPLVRLFRKSTVNDPRNPLNVKLKQFRIEDADLYDISRLVYDNSREFREAVNPEGVRLAYAGSQIGGVSLNKRIEIRYSIDMDGWTVRELLNCLACVSVNNGMSWLFQYDNNKAYPDNFLLRKF